MSKAMSFSEGRAAAGRVAKWLLDKSRPDDAVAVLSAWAANGPNDAEGQNLLAEAFRIDPSASVAKLAFERMEGIAGDHQTLDDAIRRFAAEELEKLEKEIARPNFRRAQVGFNNNIKYKGHVYHIQTEDSGLDKPHVITHLFADGGRILKSHKRSYADAVTRPDVAPYVRQIMKSQQMEMAILLREGRFDEIIAGKARGGLEVLEHPPRAEVQKLATKKEDKVEAPPERSPSALPPNDVAQPVHEPAATGPVHFRLSVMRSLSGGPLDYAPVGDEAIIGSTGAIAVPGERFCHAREARLFRKDGRVWLEDLPGGNGVFLRIRGPIEVDVGAEFIVGDQLLRVEKNPIANDGPDPGPTYFYSSPRWVSSFRVTQIFEGGSPGACALARGSTLQIGSGLGDLVFASDPLISEAHCVIEEQAGAIVLSDLQSRTGVFVRIKGTQELLSGDEVMVGRTRLMLEVV